MEATKKAGLIIDYKVFRLTPKSPDLPNIKRWLRYFGHGYKWISVRA
jgi:hypothetical protein